MKLTVSLNNNQCSIWDEWPTVGLLVFFPAEMCFAMAPQLSRLGETNLVVS